MQRLLDIILSGTAIIFLMPFLLPLLLALRFTGEGEIFYIQQRVGRYGEPFGLIKFATMFKNSEHTGTGDITIKNDPRVLPLGKFLRKTKLNELPQLINILKGDISVVGPRPMTQKIYQHYDRETQEVLNTIRPGLTGIGSIVFRDEERYLDGRDDPFTFYKEVIIPYKSSLEVWYVRNKSIRLYFLLTLLTALAVMLPDTTSWTRKILPSLPKTPTSLT
jgi:lipopolysaccharide/colanic/teichoic acid biosynthesis glycosyltransferase